MLSREILPDAPRSSLNFSFSEEMAPLTLHWSGVLLSVLLHSGLLCQKDGDLSIKHQLEF